MEEHDRPRSGPGADLSEKARQQSQAVIGEAREAGAHIIDDQKRVLAGQSSRLAHALHETAGRLREQGDSGIGDYTEWAAGGLDRFSDNLEHRSLNDLFRQANDFARDRPLVFLGGAMLAGFALSRFLKSSQPDPEEYGHAEEPTHRRAVDPTLEPPHRTASGMHPRAEAEYGELATRKPGAPRKPEEGRHG